MIKSKVWSGEILRGKSISLPPPFLLWVLVVLLAGGFGILIPPIVNRLSPALNRFENLGVFGSSFWVAVVSILLIALIISLRECELAATVIIAAGIILDWYLGFYIIAPIMGLVMLLIFFLGRSTEHPWAMPRFLWLWMLFLGLCMIPAIRGATTPYDTLTYYPNVIFGAFIMFWLGTVIARNTASIRRFFSLLACFSTFIAAHCLFQSVTGHFLFLTENRAAYLASVSDYNLGSSGVARAGSFFIQPDISSAFFAMTIFIPLALFVASSSLLAKVLYLGQIILIAVALLFTYGTGAWLSACVGVVVFIVLVGSLRYRVQLLLSFIITIALLLLGFSSQITLLLQHTLDPSHLPARQALWETALQVIRAFPLVGIGMGRATYLVGAEPYRVPAQVVPFNNPHNSYLELGAMAGLPVLFMFLALLSLALWQALRNWKRMDSRGRSLFGGGIAAIATLSFNNFSFGLWTLAPIAVLGWLLLGSIASPLIAKE
jgi:O-antigen ligase